MQDPRLMKPVNINLHQKSRVLEIEYDDGSVYQLPCEYLRVYSPSAEVTGHGPGQEILQLNKEEVTIESIEPQGNYALKFVFDDKHDTDYYSDQRKSIFTHILRKGMPVTVGRYRLGDQGEKSQEYQAIYHIGETLQTAEL